MGEFGVADGEDMQTWIRRMESKGESIEQTERFLEVAQDHYEARIMEINARLQSGLAGTRSTGRNAQGLSAKVEARRRKNAEEHGRLAALKKSQLAEWSRAYKKRIAEAKERARAPSSGTPVPKIDRQKEMEERERLRQERARELSQGNREFAARVAKAREGGREAAKLRPEVEERERLRQEKEREMREKEREYKARLAETTVTGRDAKSLSPEIEEKRRKDAEDRLNKQNALKHQLRE